MKNGQGTRLVVWPSRAAGTGTCLSSSEFVRRRSPRTEQGNPDGLDQSFFRKKRASAAGTRPGITVENAGMVYDLGDE